MTLSQAQQLIGKRVIIKNVFHGKHTSEVGGILNFVGPNKLMGNKLQVTVDRLPLFIKSLDQIEELPDRRIFKKK